MSDIRSICLKAKECKTSLLRLSTNEKNQGLKAVAQALIDNAKTIMAANAMDMENGKTKGLNQGLLDRLFLDEKRISAMAEGLVQIAGPMDCLLAKKLFHLELWA